ncbi:MAG: 50S ribosomal protein L17 [Candidatus Vogelbacteria bacterium]|nr:50S ribosomal protein L17 [Candidatus Vogelbacteria bacterium]
MRHHDHHRKFGRKLGPRRALLKSLAVALIARGRVRTTEARAKSLRPLIEKMVTRSRRGDLAAKRLLLGRLGNIKAMRKLTTEIGPRYATRPGGYTRISKLPRRASDGSPMAIIEFV